MQIINDWEYNHKDNPSGPWDNAEDAWYMAQVMQFHRDSWMYCTQITKTRDGKYMVYFTKRQNINI